MALGAAGLERPSSGIGALDVLDVLYGKSRSHHEETRQHQSQILPNCLTASLMERNFSMKGIMRCSVSSSSRAFLSTSAAFARGTTATPSSSAVTISPAFT